MEIDPNDEQLRANRCPQEIDGTAASFTAIKLYFVFLFVSCDMIPGGSPDQKWEFLRQQMEHEGFAEYDCFGEIISQLSYT